MIKKILKRIIDKEDKGIGLPPGTVNLEPGVQKVHIHRITYNEKFAEQEELMSIEHALNDLSDQSFFDKLLKKIDEISSDSQIHWININGLDAQLIKNLGEALKIHPLILEDISHTTQRPKVEDHDEHIYVVLKMLTYDDQKDEIQPEQISFILGSGYVISFQEHEGDVFNPIRNRILQNKGRIRKMGSDYLMYSLLDAIVDNYFIVLDMISEDIEDVEKDVEKATDQDSLKKIHKIRQEVTFLRKYVTPLKELVTGLIKSESALVSEPTIIYLRDLKDHTLQVIDALEIVRDLIANSLEIYLSTINNKMNGVMKVLTIMASIFIPLTFIAGIYGMNFQYMPELSIKWAYPTVLTVMLFVAALMLTIFKRNKWF